MYQKLITCLLLTGTFSLAVHAQETQDVRTAFQEIAVIPEQEIEVPTVIEVALPEMTGKKTQFIVLEESTDVSVASLFLQEFAVEPVSYVITVNGVLVPDLIDEEPETSTTFPVPDSGSGLVELYIEGESEFTASAFAVDLAKNVSLPVSVEVKALREEGDETVLARLKPRTTYVRFPETTAKNWYVAFEYIQPLRLNEFRFLQDDVESSVSNSLRFLAQPETSYEVYLDPEVYVQLPFVEGGDLRSDEDVYVVSDDILIENNVDFVFADTDEDSIPDLEDNCVSVANPGQEDVNRNDRGDACDDFDKDGVLNISDNCQDTPNRNQADEDGDRVGDVCDQEESRTTEKHDWIPWVAMGVAVLLFVVLFWVMIARNEDEEPKEKEEMKQPVSDR